MAKQRIINTRFWIDDYVSNLDPMEKLLFLYLITNPSTEICGVYELPIKMMAVQTGIEKEMVVKILNRFEKDKKIVHKDGWVVIINFSKHQNPNPSVIKGVERALSEIPPKIREIYEKIQAGYSLSQAVALKPKLKPKLKPTVTEQSSDKLSIKNKNMKTNSFGKYNENQSSDSFEDVVDLDTGEVVTEKKANLNVKYKEMIDWAEKRRGTPFLKESTLKMFKAFKMARGNNIDPKKLKDRWIEMENDNFYKVKGFDWMDVVLSFNKKA